MRLLRFNWTRHSLDFQTSSAQESLYVDAYMHFSLCVTGAFNFQNTLSRFVLLSSIESTLSQQAIAIRNCVSRNIWNNLIFVSQIFNIWIIKYQFPRQKCLWNTTQLLDIEFNGWKSRMINSHYAISKLLDRKIALPHWIHIYFLKGNHWKIHVFLIVICISTGYIQLLQCTSDIRTLW